MYKNNNWLSRKLQKGQKITVYGKCRAFIMLSVLMKKCEITENLSDLE